MNQVTSASLRYPLSVFNKNSTLSRYDIKGRGKRGGQTWEDRKEKHGLGDNGEGDSKKKAKEEEELGGTCSGVSVKHTRGSMGSNADSRRGRKWRL